MSPAQMEFVVFRLVQSDPEMWNPVYVDVLAESENEAIRITATDVGEGTYVAVPNTFWKGQEVKVKRIAEVDMVPVELV